MTVICVDCFCNVAVKFYKQSYMDGGVKHRIVSDASNWTFMIIYTVSSTPSWDV